MSTPVWQAESKKDHEFVRRKAGLAPLRFYIYIQLNFCLGVKSGKSNCTFVGQGLCSCPTMQRSALVFIQERHSRLVPYDVQIGFLLPCAVKLKITVPIFMYDYKNAGLTVRR